MNLQGFQGLSLIEYPGKLSSILFTCGCDFRCPFCHNPGLVEASACGPGLQIEEAIGLLKQRRGFIDAVCITGGEPLLNRDMPELCRMLREMGVLVKVDTNGHHPKILGEMLAEDLVDYVAMDIKAPLDQYHRAAGKLVDLSKIEQSLKALLDWDGDYEFRTTVVPGLIGSQQVERIVQTIPGARRYALHQFRPHVTFDPSFADLEPLPAEELQRMAGIARNYIGEVLLRGV